MLRRLLSWTAGAAVTGLIGAHCANAESIRPPRNEPSSVVWRPLAIGAGGLLTGIDIAPDGTKVVKADVFGAYIWNTVNNKWDQLVTASSGLLALAGAHGVWEIRIAPSLTSRLFMIYNNEVYRSDNRGASWLKTPMTGIVGADANGGGKFANQKMAIDPVNANVVYVGTPTSGLWRSYDAGVTWKHVSEIATGTSPGIAGIVIDPSAGTTNGRTRTIYVPSFGQGVWRSTDAGETWTKISGGTQVGPTEVWTAQLGADGVYWCTDHKDIWKYYAGAWTKLSPNGKSYGAKTIVTDPNRPGRVILSGPSGGKAGLETLDNGLTWVGGWQWNYPPPGQKQIATDIPWLAHSDTSYMTIGDMKIDPTDGLVYFAEGIGVWKADWPKSHVAFDWISQSLGIEELVANDIIAPPGGKLLTASWDRPFFRSDDPAKFPSKYGPIDGVFSGGWGIDYASSAPSFVVGLANWGATDISGYSSDGGETWRQFAAKPVWKLGGCIAAATPSNIVWVSGNNGLPYYTKDGGATWHLAPGLPSEGWVFSYYLRRHIVAADRVAIGTFFLYNFKHGLFKSIDSGDHWSLVYGAEIAPASGSNARLRATPNHAGHLWFTAGPQSAAHPYSGGYFMRSVDGGLTWRTIPHVLEVIDFGFGKAKTSSSYPTIYIVGWVNGIYGIWRSDDEAMSWINIGTHPYNHVDSITTINGDMDSYGTVYVGFRGSGFAYGKLQRH
jgi:photosystem II stability/assembly factor-like uncharacterized protein